MPRHTQVKGQTGLDEKQVDDKVLEGHLEERQRLLERRAALNKAYKTLKETIAGRTAEHGLAPGQPIRVGAYRLEIRTTPARHVEFDARAGESLSITGGELDLDDEPEAPEELRDLLPDMPE